MRLVETTSFRRGKLPHWEIKGGRYFVTVRLADSLPRDVVARLQEIHHSLSAVKSASTQFTALHREYFQTMEKYLDAGTGACLLRDSIAATIVRDELIALDDWSVAVPHYSIMPNHWHALLVPAPDCTHSLDEIIKRLKGRTGRRIRAATKTSGTGPMWQRERFDRWMRDDAEWEKTVTYIRNNPINAGLAARWEEHAWTR
jgi:REP element-mobilizing transposase RayT